MLESSVSRRRELRSCSNNKSPSSFSDTDGAPVSPSFIFTKRRARERAQRHLFEARTTSDPVVFRVTRFRS
ncbi:hypothetical protein NDU88_001300 [Pleurodeles waltl]|uniref:Uncharacterized protein n=1 Tax=Pleurodeles waltl TaxID=8319 RepID=A0AAV7V9T1_PLEWA|nr:hypothetical protein NDU88_001300 [Pleurodeles waltl]